jgi:hypothetical protein
MRLALIAPAVGALLLDALPAPSVEIEVTCGVCSASAIPEPMRNADVQFSAVISGRSGRLGELLGLSVASAPAWLRHEPLLKCVGRWRATGLAEGTSVTVVFVWKWGAWRRMSIAAGAAKYAIDLEPDEGSEESGTIGQSGTSRAPGADNGELRQPAHGR